MKKKILSALLLVAFAFAATSTVTSCKDYDDEINDLKTLVNDRATIAALEQAKTDLTNQINTLKGQLETQQGKITALETEIANLKTEAAKHATKAELQAEVDRAKGAEAALLARIETAEGAINTINATLADLQANKLDKTEFTEKVAEIYAKMEAVQTDLGAKIAALDSKIQEEATQRAAAIEDLNQQITALKTYVDAQDGVLDGKIDGVKSELDGKIADLIGQLETLRQAVSNNSAAIATHTTDIAKLKQDMQAASDKIDQLFKEINVLNVLIKNTLRSLVFKPDFYYYGIEATNLLALNYKAFTLDATDYATKESKGYEHEANVDYKATGLDRNEDHERYAYEEKYRVLTFVANYHLNPSNADLTDAKVNVLSNDVPFVVDTRAAECGLGVKSFDWKSEPGMLKVFLDVKDPEAIKTVTGDEMVTNFATSVTLNKAGVDTTITSDYATLTKKVIKDVVLAHTPKTIDANFTGVMNKHCGACALEGKDGSHLFATVHEAAGPESNDNHFAAQDKCAWNSTLDLTKLVETHYTTTDDKHALMSADELLANGLSYKFELTGVYYGKNGTSESAHAAIKDNIFRPQMVEEGTGKQQAYGAPQGRQTIGRTPVVRVSLVDAAGDVLDYGYIRIEITDTTPDPVVVNMLHVDYTADNWSVVYNDCDGVTANGTGYKNTWYQTEYDIYNLPELNMSREQFEKNYKVDEVDNVIKQYIGKTDSKGNTTFIEAKADEYRGTIYHYAEGQAEETGTRTNVVEWVITDQEAIQYFVTNKETNVDRAMRFISDDDAYPDVYVWFKTGNITVTKEDITAHGTVKWDNDKIAQYWYKTNTAEAGKAEIHSNVITPEDSKNPDTDGNFLNNTFSDVFVGNQILKSWIEVADDNTKSKAFASDKLNIDLVFSVENNGKEYKGIDGKTYKMSISDDGQKLYGNGELVAKLAYFPENSTNLKDKRIEYQHGAAAHALLNYKAHNELADDVINAIISLKATSAKCGELPLENNTFDVRFLRPINLFSKNKVIEDASVEGLQEIKLWDLVSFTDWRDAWKGEVPGGSYAKYYGIKAIKVVGVEDGARISSNLDVKTDLNGTAGVCDKSLREVSDQLDFVFDATNSKLVYRNLSSTVQEFTLEIPVAVEYYWGEVPATIKVTVQRTHHNAKQN